MRYSAYVLLIAATAALGACQTDSRSQVLEATKSQVQLRSFQTRAYDTTDQPKMLRTIIATLQDLGFVIDKADSVLGSVSATKLNGYMLRITVTTRLRNDTQTLVRANAQYNITPVDDPAPYQNFFDALSKAIFLEAHEVEG